MQSSYYELSNCHILLTAFVWKRKLVFDYMVSCVGKVAYAYKGEFDLESSRIDSWAPKKRWREGVEERKLENLCQVGVKSNLHRTDS